MLLAFFSDVLFEFRDTGDRYGRIDTVFVSARRHCEVVMWMKSCVKMLVLSVDGQSALENE